MLCFTKRMVRKILYLYFHEKSIVLTRKYRTNYKRLIYILCCILNILAAYGIKTHSETRTPRYSRLPKYRKHNILCFPKRTVTAFSHKNPRFRSRKPANRKKFGKSKRIFEKRLTNGAHYCIIYKRSANAPLAQWIECPATNR